MRRGLLAIAVLLIPAAATARVDYNTMIPALLAHDTRLLSIGWRIARANAPLCRDSAPAAGLMLADLGQLDRPAEARGVLGIGGNLAIVAVAPGGPAQRAGISAGEQLVAVDGVAVADSDSAHDRIEAALAAGGAATLTVDAPHSAPRNVRISGEPACKGQFQLLVGNKSAQTDGRHILVSVELLAERPQDEEAAFMIAHELAHVALDHRRRLDAGTRNYITIRRTEREADRLAPWLMANAGYDPTAAVRFMAWWGPRYSGGITRRPDHDGWRDRLELIEAEVTKIQAARAAQPQGLLDWRGRFSVGPPQQ
jgi:hypothetical protein